jgi:3-deoxy-D-manno-octulosonic-acid transferase
MTKNAFILNFLKLYNMAWRSALPFLKKNNRLQPGLDSRIHGLNHKEIDVWIQAASAGEAYLAIMLAKALSESSSLTILITTTTSQGMDIIQSYTKSSDNRTEGQIISDWFPFDLPKVMEKTIQSMTPKVVVMLETEIWPALFHTCKLNNTQLFIINARLSRKSFSRYRKTTFLWQHLTPDRILATSNEDAARYRKIFTAARVDVMPNIKFDAALQFETAQKEHPILNQIRKTGLPFTIFASIRTQEEDEVISIIQSIKTSFPDQIIAVFPRHMERLAAWNALLEKTSLGFQLRSEFKNNTMGDGIILWDIFGELTSAYTYADTVFVGGSLKPLGGQNFIEPVVSGALTITGPYNDDFKWVHRSIFTNNIILERDTPEAVVQTILENLKTPAGRGEIQKRAQSYIKSHQGGTELACREILKAFDEPI